MPSASRAGSRRIANSVKAIKAKVATRRQNNDGIRVIKGW